MTDDQKRLLDMLVNLHAKTGACSGGTLFVHMKERYGAEWTLDRVRSVMAELIDGGYVSRGA